jgi:hypothetical protein
MNKAFFFGSKFDEQSFFFGSKFDIYILMYRVKCYCLNQIYSMTSYVDKLYSITSYVDTSN